MPHLRKPRVSLRGLNGTLMALWNDGLNDCQIAREIGCPPGAVLQWRRRNELPRNSERGQPAYED